MTVSPPTPDGPRATHEAAATVRACEDCGDPTPYRRWRCPACRKLICNWCRGHIHNRPAALASVVRDG